MIKSITENREAILNSLMKKSLNFTIIDPGTNCSFRYVRIWIDNGSILSQTLGHFFFKGSSAGANFIERMSMLSKNLGQEVLFCTSDYYIIEEQFENNVYISVGVLIGIISNLRCNSVQTRLKARSAVATPCDMPYQIYSIPCYFKTRILEQYSSITGDLKLKAVEAAVKLCESTGDTNTVALMNSVIQSHDIADTVCYQKALIMFLSSANNIQKTKFKYKT